MASHAEPLTSAAAARVLSQQLLMCCTADVSAQYVAQRDEE
jgi:hypothetical protein